jgi:hypothetical protein
MADRYWVGGTGTWSSSSTANWSTATGKSITASCASTTLTVTAGTVVIGDTIWSNSHTSLGTITVNLGGGQWTVSVGGTFASQAMSAATVGASVPTAADSVFFNATSNSGTTAFTVTMANTPRLCNDFTASGLDGTMTLAGSGIGLTVSGSLAFQSTNFTRTYTGTTTFNATTTGKTINTATVAFGADVTFDGVGGGWTLSAALSVTGTNAITLTNGTLDTSGSNHNISSSTFSSNNANTRTLTLNGSTFTLSGVSASAWNINASLTLNVGTSTIAFSANGPTFAGASRTYYAVSFTATAAGDNIKAITGSNTFTNLTFATPSSAGLNRCTVGGNQTVTGTLAATGSNGNQRLWISSDVIGTSRTLTCAAIAAMSDVDFSDITIAGAVGTLSGTRLGNAGGNSNITLGAGTTKYWNLAAGGNWTANAWATSSGGAVATTNYPLPQDTAIIEDAGLNTSATITIPNNLNISAVNMSTRLNSMTFDTSADSPTFYGNFSSGVGVSIAGTDTIIFSNRSTKTIDSNGVNFSQPIEINAPGGGIQLINNDIITTETVQLTNGTLDLNGKSLNIASFSTATGTKNITFNGGLLILFSSGNAFNNAAPTGFTTTAGTGTGRIVLSSSTPMNFIGGGSTYNCTLQVDNFSGIGALTITGSNTFSDISNAVVPAAFIFTAGTTNTFTNFSLAGTAGNLVTLRSSSAGTRYTLSDSSGIVSVSYLDIQDSAATGGASWRAYTTNGNVDSGNNSGWLFSAGGGNFLMLF